MFNFPKSIFDPFRLQPFCKVTPQRGLNYLFKFSQSFVLLCLLFRVPGVFTGKKGRTRGSQRCTPVGIRLKVVTSRTGTTEMWRDDFDETVYHSLSLAIHSPLEDEERNPLKR